MPDASIAVTLHDRYSDAAKKMATATRHFSKDVDGLEAQLESLDKNKFQLKLDAKDARTALREAEKQFDLTRDAADRFNLEMAQANYDNIQRNLKAVSQAARETEREISRVQNRAEGGGGGGAGDNGPGMGRQLGQMLGAAGIGSMAADLLKEGVGIAASSAFGSDLGGMISSTLSTGVSGATAGFMVGGPVGAVVGGLAGAAGGMLSGGMQAFGKRDDAFKGYVQESVETQLEDQQTTLTAGSGLAAQRETDAIAFSTLYGSEEKADAYLKNLVGMANHTPFLYQDLTAMSKTLATYGYDDTNTIPALTKIGDAGAALGHTVQDMEQVATALGRMRSSNKTSLDYINMLNDRGIDAVGMLAEHYGVDKGGIYDRISRGQLQGTETVDIILDAMGAAYGGSMERQSQTYAGLSSTVEGLNQEQDNAMGQGYNDTRKKGLADQISWMDGESGAAVQEANKAIGAWRAELDNSRDAFYREAMDKAMASQAYQDAQAQGDAAKQGEIIMRAKIEAQNQFNASEGAQLLLESEKSLIAAVREDTALQSEYWDTGYRMGQEFDRGIAAARFGQGGELKPRLAPDSYAASTGGQLPRLDVPASTYAAAGSNPGAVHNHNSVRVNMSGTVIREEADIDKVASALVEKIALNRGRG